MYLLTRALEARRKGRKGSVDDERAGATPSPARPLAFARTLHSSQPGGNLLTANPTTLPQIITRKASIRVAEYAFKYAKDNNRCVRVSEQERLNPLWRGLARAQHMAPLRSLPGAV